jgi:hypothetical protein
LRFDTVRVVNVLRAAVRCGAVQCRAGVGSGPWFQVSNRFS